MATSVVDAGGSAARHTPRGRPTKRRRFGVSRRDASGFVTVGVIATTVIAMAITLFGAGAIGRALSLHDGAIWLWDSGRGEAVRVNAAAGQVDMRRSLVDARGHRVIVVQTDENLLLQDLDSGTVTSFDLTTLNVSGVVAIPRPSDMRVSLFGHNALITDTASGLVRQLDAGSLDPIGKPLQLPPNLVGGEFDGEGKLWVGEPKHGKVVAVKLGSNGAGPSIDKTIDVGHAGHDWSMTTLDAGAGIVDRATSQFVRVTSNGGISSLQLSPVGAATMPGRLRGDVVAVTNPAARTIILIHGDQVTTVPIPGAGDQIGPALVFAQRLYVPDAQDNRIQVFDLSGKPMQDIDAPGGEVGLEHRENHLIINSVGTDKAWVVDTQHQVKQLGKEPKDVANGEDPGKQTPPPNHNPGNGGGTQHIQRPNPPKNNGPGTPDPGKPSGHQSVPGAPRDVRATVGDSSATVSWGTADPRGSTIEKYVITGGNRPINVSGDARSVNVVGLVNGKSYQFSVHAVNGKGNGPSATSNSVTPTSVIPNAPTEVKAVANPDGGVMVGWSAPHTNGGTIASYSLDGRTSIPGGQVRVGNIASTNVVVPASSLTMGATYTFTITAILTNGAASQPSAPSNAVTTQTKPGEPRSVTAEGAGVGALTVSWRAAVANGSPITGYTVSSSSGQRVEAGASATSAKLTGLPQGNRVTITVTAHSAVGDTASEPVTAIVPAFTAVGTVTCINPNGSTFCDSGVKAYDAPGGTVQGSFPNGAQVTAVCRSEGPAVYANEYNTENGRYSYGKHSGWWMRLPDGRFIPYAWINFPGPENQVWHELQPCYNLAS